MKPMLFISRNAMSFWFNVIILLCFASIFFKTSTEYQCADFGISAIIAALISASAATAAGVAQKKATEKAGKESLQLAGIARGDSLKQMATTNRQNQEAIDITKQKFGYQKQMEREVANKTSIANLGTSLKMLGKSNMDMQQFISSLYGGNTVRKMG